MLDWIVYPTIGLGIVYCWWTMRGPMIMRKDSYTATAKAKHIQSIDAGQRLKQ